MIAWVLASVIIVVLALVHAELGGLFPVAGGTSRYAHFAFGSLAGATFGWSAFLCAASSAPIEVTGAIQYLASTHWAAGFFVNHEIHGLGWVIAIALLLAFLVINALGVTLLHASTTT